MIRGKYNNLKFLQFMQHWSICFHKDLILLIHMPVHQKHGNRINSKKKTSGKSHYVKHKVEGKCTSIALLSVSGQIFQVPSWFSNWRPNMKTTAHVHRYSVNPKAKTEHFLLNLRSCMLEPYIIIKVKIWLHLRNNFTNSIQRWTTQNPKCKRWALIRK